MFAGYRGIVVVAAILILAVGGLAVWLYVELRESNDLLAETQAALTETEKVLSGTLATLSATKVTLAETQDDLADTQADLRETDDALAEQRSANVDLTAENRLLETAKEAVEAANDDLETDLRAANDTNIALSSENDGLRADLTTTIADRDGLRGELASANFELGALTATHNALETSHMTLTGQFEDLKAQAGTAEGLREEIRTLRQEILGLEEARKPLILGVDAKRRSGFACTGSMEPVVTCLDEATWLEDFRPEDITVGATIAFHPGCGDDVSGRGTAHRVEAIEVRGGVHYYWPKGDNNLAADGCWIPEQNIRGYIVEMHRNVRPENAELRELVNEAIDTWKEAVAAYFALYDRYCERGQRCTVPTNVFVRLQTLERAWESTLDDLACWQESAKASQYPGHIPWRC